jgi:tRNA modification GTPase
VRLSGARAVEIADGLVEHAAVRVDEMPDRMVQRVTLVDPSTRDALDEALVVVMRAPHSYTGEDVVELSCHGSVALLDLIVDRCVALGARPAARGEFTRRAFVNGRIDLAQAEAVAMLIGADDEQGVKAAARAVLGQQSGVLRAARERLVEVMAGLEVALDFPEDEDGGRARAVDASRQVADITGEIRSIERRMCQRSGTGTVTIAVVGAPNAGKSTLFNALIGHDRAIVSAIPGTTRDVVEARGSVAGVSVLFRDTAGLGPATDPIEAEGVARARRAILDSHVVLVAMDGTTCGTAVVDEVADDRQRGLQESTGATGRNGRTVLVTTKADIARDLEPRPGSVLVSAKTGQGMDALRDRLAAEVLGVAGDALMAGWIAASDRQRQGLRRSIAALEEAASALTTLPSEVGLVDLARALEDLDEVLGINTGDAVLDRVFATFCIGK